MEQYKDKFVSHLRKFYHAHKTNGNVYWTHMIRDFKRIYNQNSVKHYLHFTRAGVNTNDVYTLVAYMLSKGIISIDSGVSVGKALKSCERDEKTVNNLIGLPLNRLIPKLKQLTGLMASNNIKLNADWLCRDLFSWDNQSKHSNSNWIIKYWVRDYYNDKQEKTDGIK